MKALYFFTLLFWFVSVEAETEAYQYTKWVELIPKKDLEALYNPPEEIMNIPEGAENDAIANDVFKTLMQAKNGAYQDALASTDVIESMNNKKIKIPGFVVPVVIDGNKTTEFFIVPYFGACIHFPPPPPNQTIYAKYSKGFNLKNMYEPYDFSGLLTTSIKTHDLATSAYHLSIDLVETYQEPNIN